MREALSEDRARVQIGRIFKIWINGIIETKIEILP